MKLFAALLLVMSIGFGYSVEANGQEQPYRCTPSKYSAVYVNGVFNDVEDAWFTLAAMRGSVGATSFTGRPIDFRLAYNPSKGADDILDAINQASNELGVPYQLVAAVYLSGGVGLTVASRRLPPALRATLQEEVANRLIRRYTDYLGGLIAGRAVDAIDPDYRSLLAKVSTLPLDSGIVLVGHSQGTFYGNLLYRGLLTQPGRRAETLAVRSIAAVVPAVDARPAEPIVRHATSSTDLVVATVRALTFGNVLGNTGSTTSVLPEEDRTGHDAVLIYLNSRYELQTQVRFMVKSAVDDLVLPIDEFAVSSCQVRLRIGAAEPGWVVSEEILMAGLRSVNRAQFASFGTSGNTCGSGERGSPLYSLDPRIAPEAAFLEAPNVQGVPYFGGFAPNRRPCSSFVAIVAVPDPSGAVPPRPSRNRIWANATGRVQSFVGGFTADREFQVRYDSGDPWDGRGYRCDVGFLPNAFASFAPSWSSSSCTSVFEVTPAP